MSILLLIIQDPVTVAIFLLALFAMVALFSIVLF
jgi:hypothetical protein